MGFARVSCYISYGVEVRRQEAEGTRLLPPGLTSYREKKQKICRDPSEGTYLLT